MKICSLASGSKGNATLVRCASGSFLIDMGISCTRVKQALQSLHLRMRLRVSDYGQLSTLLGKLDALPGVERAQRLG